MMRAEEPVVDATPVVPVAIPVVPEVVPPVVVPPVVVPPVVVPPVVVVVPPVVPLVVAAPVVAAVVAAPVVAAPVVAAVVAEPVVVGLTNGVSLAQMARVAPQWNTIDIEEVTGKAMGAQKFTAAGVDGVRAFVPTDEGLKVKAPV